MRRNDSPLLEMVNDEVKNQAERGWITTSLDHDSVQIADSIGYFRLFPLFPSATVWCLHHLRFIKYKTVSAITTVVHSCPRVIEAEE